MTEQERQRLERLAAEQKAAEEAARRQELEHVAAHAARMREAAERKLAGGGR